MADFTVDLKDSQKGSTVRAEVYTCANDAYQKVIDKLSESQLTDVQVDGNKVSGSIDAKEDGTLLLTVPYDAGWTITVDGQETDFYSVGKALTGVHVSAGNHTIAMKFTPPGFVLGLVLSLVSVLLYLVRFCWRTVIGSGSRRGRIWGGFRRKMRMRRQRLLSHTVLKMRMSWRTGFWKRTLRRRLIKIIYR